MITGDLVFSGEATSGVNAGQYSITASGLELSDAGKRDQQGFLIQFVDGTLTIDPKALTVTAGNQSKTYGDALTLDNTAFTTTGLVSGETVDSATLTSTNNIDSDTTADAGTYADNITASAVSGSNGFNNANYSITYEAGDLIVSQRGITVSADNQSKTYGDSLVLDNTAFSASNLANGERIDTVTLTSASGSDSNTGAGAGTYTGDIVASGVAGSNGFNAANYAIAYASADLVVDKATLTVTADDQNITAGDSLPTLTQSISGFVNGEGLATAGVTGAGTTATAATADSPVGSYVINSGQGTLAAANYTFALVNGTLTIASLVSPAPTPAPTPAAPQTRPVSDPAVEVIQQRLNDLAGTRRQGSGTTGSLSGTTGEPTTRGGSSGPVSAEEIIQQSVNRLCDSCMTLSSDGTGTTTGTAGRQGPATGTGGLTPASSPINDKVIQGLITQAGQADSAAKQAQILATSDPVSQEKKITANTLQLASERARKAVDEAIQTKVSEQNAAANQAPSTPDRIPKDRSDQVDELMEAFTKKAKVFAYAMGGLFGAVAGGTNEEHKKQGEEIEKLNAEADGVLKKYDVDTTNFFESKLFDTKVQTMFTAQSNSKKVLEERQAAAKDLADKKAVVAEAQRKAKASKEAAERARKEADADPGNLQKAMNAQFAELKASSDGGEARKAEVDVSTAEATLSDKDAKVAANKATIAIGKAQLGANLAEKEKTDALEKTRQATADAGQKAIAIVTAKIRVAEAEVAQEKSKEVAASAENNVGVVKTQQVAANDTFSKADTAHKAKASTVPAIVTEADKLTKEADAIVQKNAAQVVIDKNETIRQGYHAEWSSFTKRIESLLGAMRNAYGENYLASSGHAKGVYNLWQQYRSLSMGTTVEDARKAAEDAKVIVGQMYNLVGGLGNAGIDHERNRLGTALNPDVLKTVNADAQDAYFQHTQRELKTRQVRAQAAQAKAAEAQQKASAAKAELDRLNQALLIAQQNKELAPAQLQAAIKQAEEAKQNVIRAEQASSQLASEVVRAEKLAAEALQASLNAKAASEEAIRESAAARKAAEKVLAQQAAEEKAWNDKAVAAHKASIDEMSSYAKEAQASYEKATDLSAKAKADQKEWQTLYDTKTAAIPGLEKKAQQDEAAAAAAKATFDATELELESLETEFKAADSAQLDAQVELAKAQAARDALGTEVKLGNVLEIATTIASAASNTQEKKKAAQARLVQAQAKYDRLLKVAEQKRDAYNGTLERQKAEADVANKAADTAAKSKQAAAQAKLDKDVAGKNVEILDKYVKETSAHARKMLREASNARDIVNQNS
ncbi:MAG: MBG domain-containing protein [Oleiphilaceae bacterium]|nr:MBG domain-containing protein [Oleiphilaceae bacterium]